MDKFRLALLGLLLSVAGTLCAQVNNENDKSEAKPFELPPYSIDIIYKIRLGNGNMLHMQLANGYDLHSFRNIDSLLSSVVNDLKPFSDSLSDPLTVKHLDYLIDQTGKKKLRIRQYRPAATSFLLDGPEPAILRTQQDTINILIITKAGPHSGHTINGLRYDRLSFFINHYSELETIATTGLNAKIASIISGQPVKSNVYSHPFSYGMEDSVGETTYPTRQFNQLEINAGAAIENYKSYFAPSFVVRAMVILHLPRNLYYFGVSWEPIFLFSPNAQGHLQTYVNNLVVLNYEHDHTDLKNGKEVLKPNFSLDPAFSFGYFISPQGNFFTKPAFRLTYGAAKFGGNLRIEPCLFFNGFFRNATPGLRLSTGF
jgi:hypothetical protein